MRKSRRYANLFLALMFLATLVSSCSTTKAVPEGEQLFTGLGKIKFENYEKNEYADETKKEMEGVLASAPNGSLFGSSYYRSPFPIRLWIWNAFSQSDSKVGKWLAKTFGAKPKLMSQVNPELRGQIADLQLKKFGYFHGKTRYEVVNQRNPKKAKIAYTVNMGLVWKLDSIRYTNFSPFADSLIEATKDKAYIRNGEPFNVSNLDSERKRISRMLRNNGYYYYKEEYASYLADTLAQPGKVLLRFQMADSLPDSATKKWHIGNINVNFRDRLGEDLRDSVAHPLFTMHFNGGKPPVRPSVIRGGLKFHPGQLYKLNTENATRYAIQGTGLFSFANLSFVPRDTLGASGLLDLNIDLLFDKPYDFYIKGNAKGKTSGRYGPELVIGLTKKNAFRGSELLDINLHGSYEWQTGHSSEGSSSALNSYEYGGDISLSMPRLLIISKMLGEIGRRDSARQYLPYSFYNTPNTTIRVGMNIMNRRGYFKRHVVSSDIAYDLWTSERSHHIYTPLSLSYEYMNSKTDTFQVLIDKNPHLSVSMRDQFVPKMTYSYVFTSYPEVRHPMRWETTISEGGNILSLGYLAAGKKWNDPNKKLFKNPFAQFLKFETDFTQLWQFSGKSALAAHLNAGVVYSYGNSKAAPYFEQFYVGGANSIRAFNIRSIGPGRYVAENRRSSYIEQTGDIKLLANIEYRPRLVSDLEGAIFLDAGNVWTMKEDEHRPGSQFKLKSFLKEVALGTGIGLRYNFGFFVIRLDWGIGLHLPYGTGKKGFYNIPSFKDGQSLHLAIGYPF